MSRERYISTGGYALIWVPGHHRANEAGYVLEHIYVMEEKLSREIKREDGEVHHKDGNKSNNHPDNLQLLSAKDHRMLHGSIRKGRYAEDVFAEITKKVSRRTRRKRGKASEGRQILKAIEKEVVWNERKNKWEKVYEYVKVAK